AKNTRRLWYVLHVLLREMQAHCSVLQGIEPAEQAPCPSFRAPEDIDPGEDARRRRVPAMDHLVGLTLAAVERAVHFEGAGIADRAQAAPEGRRDTAVVRVLDHARAPALLDELAPLAAELEFVARIVDRPRDVGANQYAAVDRADHRLERARPRLDVDVRHAIDRRPVPGAGARIRSAGESRARLREPPAERRHQGAVLDEENFA